jgi:hypothetical protein
MSDELRVSGIWRAIVKSDTVDIPRVSGLPVRAIYVGTAGTASLMDATGQVVDFELTQGVHPLRPKRVMNSGDAADMVALY